MSEVPEEYRISPEKAEEMVDDAIREGDLEGFYEAVCPCGEICGMHFHSVIGGEPPKPSKYIACPSCHRVGFKDGIEWKYVPPILEQDDEVA
tara:strand:+ start:34472 stop:34747 length:276 start_codon:yes stop_codon:yes gene_type:complete